MSGVVFTDDRAHWKRKLDAALREMRREIKAIAENNGDPAKFIKVRERAWRLSNRPELRGTVESSLDEIVAIGGELEPAQRKGDAIRDAARAKERRELRDQQREIERSRPR